MINVYKNAQTTLIILHIKIQLTKLYVVDVIKIVWLVMDLLKIIVYLVVNQWACDKITPAYQNVQTTMNYELKI